MVNFGETHTAEVYFKGTSGTHKRRPVLIVDDSEEGLITFAEITSTEPDDPPKYFDRFKVEIKDWKVAGLDRRSWVKCHRENVHRVSKDRMIKKIGKVESQVMSDVLDKIVNQ